MKNIKIFIVAIVIVTTIGACKESFLDVEPKGKFLTSNYYQNEEQAFAGLVSVYDVIRKNSGGFENMITMMNAGSDDHYAGGGGASDGAGIQGFSNYTLNATTMPRSFWSDHFQGIQRANILLEKLPAVLMDESLKARFTAETKALRAFYYFNLVRMFKNVPLFTSSVSASEMYNVTQSSPEDVYAQIETDLLDAIPVLPNVVSTSELGRLTKGAAIALLGKVYLYEGKNSEAATQLAIVNGTDFSTPNQFGYKLLDNFDDLWIVDNKFNSESILECSHSNLGDSYWGIWGGGNDEGNSVNVMVGPRTYVQVTSNAPDLPSGWSFSVITQDLYNAMVGDPRFDATILDMAALETNGDATYFHGYQNTGYFLNKFIPTTVDESTGGGDMVLNYRQDTYIIRLADTYLMEAEALGASGTRAQALLDAVRARVGLPSVPVSMNAIKAERRKELAGEGHRFFDLVRWGDAATVLASRGFTAGKNEIFPIPELELLNTKIVQNPNY